MLQLTGTAETRAARTACGSLRSDGPRQVPGAVGAGVVPRREGQPLTPRRILEDGTAAGPVGTAVRGQERSGRIDAGPERSGARRELLVVGRVLEISSGEEEEVVTSTGDQLGVVGGAQVLLHPRVEEHLDQLLDLGIVAEGAADDELPGEAPRRLRRVDPLARRHAGGVELHVVGDHRGHRGQRPAQAFPRRAQVGADAGAGPDLSIAVVIAVVRRGHHGLAFRQIGPAIVQHRLMALRSRQAWSQSRGQDVPGKMFRNGGARGRAPCEWFKLGF